MSGDASKGALYSLAPSADLHRWLLAAVMLVTVAFGWKWPVLGFIVPLAMLIGVGGAFLRGRYVCGNICPRGSFYDTFFSLVGGKRPVPLIFWDMNFRWGVVVALMSLIAFQVAQNPGDPLHWGRVFWMACAVTTAVGVGLGLYYRPRTWCSFCPVGTIANAIGGHRDLLEISPGCKGCGSCEKSCPMDFPIVAYQPEGVLPHRDCLKCSACVDSCKVGALSFPADQKTL